MANGLADVFFIDMGPRFGLLLWKLCINKRGTDVEINYL
jgi:hypothetical protein